MSIRRRVAVLHVANQREHDPRFQVVVDLLNDGAGRAISALGWDAQLVATGEAGTHAALSAVRSADLLVIMGGEDVHPRFYGGDLEYEGGGIHDERADEAQLAAVQEAARRGTPTLGICRGHQLLNVAFGGDLIQHLDANGTHRNADRSADDRFLAHPVVVDAAHEFRTSAIAGEAVQSSHHQAVGRLGTGLRAVAAGDDGVIEAIVHESAPITGVQWHPEHPRAAAGQLPRLLRRLESQLA